MKAKDAARREIIARQRYEQAQMVAMAQKEAEVRSNAAVATWLGFLQARRDDYDVKCKVRLCHNNFIENFVIILRPR
jgi:hypothetical protein